MIIGYNKLGIYNNKQDIYSEYAESQGGFYYEVDNKTNEPLNYAILNLVKNIINKAKGSQFIEPETKYINQRLKVVLKVCSRIRIDMLSNILNINQELLNKNLENWIERFGLIIEGNYITIHNKNTDINGFIADLDKQFLIWDKSLKKNC